MRIAGIDIGSRTIGFVIMDAESGHISHKEVLTSGPNPVERAEDIVKKHRFDCIVATGYGRHAAQKRFADDIITEIKAHALGSRYFYPETRTVLDIGGQDTKVILLDECGNIIDFLMNDRCAAGTGKFLEIMAAALGYELSEFGNIPLSTQNEPVRISSMGTVFAESEVISLLHPGVLREQVAKAVHESVVERAVSMLKKISFKEPVVFAGGVANNLFIKTAIERRAGVSLFVPENPQIVGAVGCAISALKLNKRKELAGN